MVDHVTYYNLIADSYDELHKEEQLKKLSLVREKGIIHNDDVLLDVGCGTGFSLDFFDVSSAIGVDPADILLSKYSGSAKTVCASAENLPFEDSSFDVVISLTAIQNFDDVKLGLEEIRRVGTSRFVLSFLKSLEKSSYLESVLRLVFKDFSIERVEEDKDFIFFITSY